MIPLLLLSAFAAPFGQVPVQGHASDDHGAPLQGDLSVVAILSDGADRWTESQIVTFENGAFTLFLGAVEPLDLALFAEPQRLSLVLTIDGDTLAPVSIAHTPLAAYAERAGHATTADEAAHAGSSDWSDDAGTLQGRGPSDFRSSTWTPAWLEISDRPPGLDDGDDDTTYSAGAGLQQLGTTFSLDGDAVRALATDVCYDEPAELADALDELLLLGGWTLPLPLDVADGDQDTTYTAGDGLLLASTTFSIDPDVVFALATEVCYDSPDELAAALDDLFILYGWLPPLPPDLTDGDQDTTYSAGDGLQLIGTTFVLDSGLVTSLATALCYDTVAELRADLDAVYLPIGWQPRWTDLLNIPEDLLDGDADTQYSAGVGLGLVGTTFSADAAWTDERARAACFDTEAELRGALDDDYRSSTWRPTWGDVQSIPADIADGDQDTRYGAGDGLSLAGTTFSADRSVARITDNPGDGRFQRAIFERLGNTIRYTMSDGTVDSLDVNSVASGATGFSPLGRIGYQHGGGTTDSSLYLSIADMAGHACMLLHDDDDVPKAGFYYATDANSSISWAGGGAAPKIFHLKREGQTGRSVIDIDQKFTLLCL